VKQAAAFARSDFGDLEAVLRSLVRDVNGDAPNLTIDPQFFEMSLQFLGHLFLCIQKFAGTTVLPCGDKSIAELD
jgi:hypothetical protein